jgi:hypothetical protein
MLFLACFIFKIRAALDFKNKTTLYENNRLISPSYLLLIVYYQKKYYNMRYYWLVLLLFFVHGLSAQDSTRLDSIPIDSNSTNIKAKAKGNKMSGNNQPDSLKKDTTIGKTAVVKADSLPITIEKVEKKPRQPRAHSPRRALLWALIPGGGQIYNRRYWKLPIVYAGVGGLGFWYVRSRIQYRCFNKAYVAAVDTDPNTNYVCPTDPTASSRVLELQKNYYRSQSEYALLGTIVFYGLTIADAFVDAHLKSFDISDDLSMRIEPKIQFSPNVGTLPQANAAISFSFAPRYVQKAANHKLVW